MPKSRDGKRMIGMVPKGTASDWSGAHENSLFPLRAVWIIQFIKYFGWQCHVNLPHWDGGENQSWFWQIFLAALLKECCTGVFLWCMISWFFAWNMNLRNYSLWAVTWRFCVTLEELKILTNISLFHYSILRDFEMRVLRMFRVLIKSDLDMRFTIWSLDVALFVFLQLHSITQRFSIVC